MQDSSYFPNSKHYEILPHCRKFIRAYYAKGFNKLSHSDFSREFFATAVNFLFSNSNMYTSKISMAKAILDFFIETKDAKH